MKSTFALKLVTFLAVIAMLGACATGPKAPRMVLNIDAASSINPDLNRRPSPVVLYLYTLKGNSIFNNARFVELYTNHKDVLGVDFLGVEEIEVSPGETLNLVQRELPEETRHIGVVAAFRDIDNATWRGSVDIKPGEKFDLNIHLENLTVLVEKH